MKPLVKFLFIWVNILSINTKYHLHRHLKKFNYDQFAAKLFNKKENINKQPLHPHNFTDFTLLEEPLDNFLCCFQEFLKDSNKILQFATDKITKKIVLNTNRHKIFAYAL